MIILALRTDRPSSELFLLNGTKQIDKTVWLADRQLAETIHKQILKLLKKNKLDLAKLEGLVCFKGPGSFTGLRIGLSVANALAYSLKIPISTAKTDDWQSIGVKKLIDGVNEKIALPYYGSDPYTTSPKH